VALPVWAGERSFFYKFVRVDNGARCDPTHINGGDGAIDKGRQARGKVDKWVEPLVPDSSPQRESETTAMRAP